MNVISLFYLSLYCLIGRLCVHGEISLDITIISSTKPFLMPCLLQSIIPLLKHNNNKKGLLLLFLALYFAWQGDVFLIPETKGVVSEVGFILGLLSFLIMQILYIIIFNSIEGIGLVSKYPLLATPYILLYVGVNYIINPYVEDLLIPVLVYSACLIYMAICSLNLVGKIPTPYAVTITVGSLLFAISDAIIAFQKFNLINTSSMTQGAIIFTYIIAQLLIVLGYILYK